MDATEYLDAAAAAATLIASPEVALRWTEPSVLAEMTTGSLAGHLARQITLVLAQLTTPAEPAETITALDHYARIEWIGAPLDAEVNVGIRRDADAEAAEGPAALAHRTESAIASLRATLPDEPAGRPVYLPWSGWSLPLADFLLTRLLEIVVHIDDLAVSVGTAPWPVPEQPTDTVLQLLTRLAVRRHGSAKVLRALSRTERAPETIAAF